jgi:hypothetical protein
MGALLIQAEMGRGRVAGNRPAWSSRWCRTSGPAAPGTPAKTMKPSSERPATGSRREDAVSGTYSFVGFVTHGKRWGGEGAKWRSLAGELESDRGEGGRARLEGVAETTAGDAALREIRRRPRWWQCWALISARTGLGLLNVGLRLLNICEEKSRVSTRVDAQATTNVAHVGSPSRSRLQQSQHYPIKYLASYSISGCRWATLRKPNCWPMWPKIISVDNGLAWPVTIGDPQNPPFDLKLCC